MNPITDAYNRFCTERFPLPTEAEVTDLEQRLGVRLPPRYRDFILKFNGGYFSDPQITPTQEGCPAEALSDMSGIHASHEGAELDNPARLSLFEDNNPRIVLPIGSTPLGGLIILCTEADIQDRILLKPAWQGFYYLADNIEEFFGLLRESP